MKTLILVLIISILSGCAGMAQIVDAGAKANDNALQAAKFTICRGASIGSVIREFDTPDKAKAWKELCTQDNNSVPIILDSN